MRRWLILGASVIVSGVFLWLALRDVPISEVIAGIRQANLAWVLLSFLGVLGSLAARAVRWRGLLNGRVSLIEAFHILNITMMLNQLPLRAGEVARSLLATRSGVPLVTAATSIVVERMLDVVAVVLMLGIALNRLPSAPVLIAQAAELFGAAALIALVVMVAFARYPQVADRLLIELESRVSLVKRLNGRKRLEEILDGLRPLTHAGRAAHAVGWTLVGWLFSLFTFYALERALAIDRVDLILGMLLGVALASLSIAIPVSVAAIGPFEGAVRVAGDTVSMSPVTATTLGFLFHGTVVLEYAVLGMVGLIVLGVSLGDMLTEPQSASKGD